MESPLDTFLSYTSYILIPGSPPPRGAGAGLLAPPGGGNERRTEKFPRACFSLDLEEHYFFYACLGRRRKTRKQNKKKKGHLSQDLSRSPHHTCFDFFNFASYPFSYTTPRTHAHATHTRDTHALLRTTLIHTHDSNLTHSPRRQRRRRLLLPRAPSPLLQPLPRLHCTRSPPPWWSFSLPRLSCERSCLCLETRKKP